MTIHFINLSFNMLSVRNISKKYGDVEALRGLSFGIEKGDVFGLLGPNGSGKTTTIRIILSIIFPDEGEVKSTFNRIGYLPEERGLYPTMRIDELIYFFGELRGMDKKEVGKQMDFWLQKLDLFDRKQDKVQSLSKGLKQRVHLLISVLHDPQFLILDEPFTGLDPIAIKGLREMIAELRIRGKTILLSTHWMEQAEQLCNTVCLIRKGKKIYGGSLKELKESHKSDEIYIEVKDKSVVDELKDIEVVAHKDEGFIIKAKKNPGKILTKLTDLTEVFEFRLTSPSLEDIFIKEIGNE